MDKKERRGLRDILIAVETHVEFIGEQIQEIKADKLRQWEKINNLSASQNHLKGWITATGAIVIGVLIKLIAF